MNANPLDQALAALGLGPREFDFAVRIPAAFERRPSSTPLGTPPPQRLEAGRRRFIQLRVPSLERISAALFADKDNGRSFVIDFLGSPTRTYGSVEVLEKGLWSLDTTAGPAAIAFDRFLVFASRTEVLIGRRRSSVRGGAPPSREPAAPDLRSLLHGHTSAPWLSHLVDSQFNEREHYSRALGLALFGRLWSPPPPSPGHKLVSPRPEGSSGRLLEALLEGRAPSSLVQDWYRGLRESPRQEIEEEAVQIAEVVQRQLPDLVGVAISQNRLRYANSVQRWVTVRDDLESIAWLSGPSRAESELGLELGRLDKAATAHLSMLAEVELRHDPRLRAVSWQEPESWWGQLALPRDRE